MSFEATLPTPPADPSVPFPYPIARPDPSSRPVPPAQVTPEQETHLQKLIDHFNDPSFTPPNQLKVLKAAHTQAQGGGSRFGRLFGGATAPTEQELADTAPLSNVEKCYWSRQAFLRCCRATKWDYAASLRRAEETLVWRREFQVEEMKESDVSREGETGKELVMGYDVNCRPVLYMHPNRQNTNVGPDQIKFVVWCLERTLDLLPPTDPAVEMLCLCIDFGAHEKGAKGQPTTLGQARKVLEILQVYYGERLGKAVLVNIPSIFFAFYKLVGPFVDPITKEKIRFLEKPDATALIPPTQLQTIFGGSVNMTYDHASYFPALTKLCAERKAANLKRWEQYGENRCGLDEAIIRGARVPGQAPGLAEGVEGDVSGANTPSLVKGQELGNGHMNGNGEVPTAQLSAISLNGVSAAKSDVVDDTPPGVVTPGAELAEFVDAPVASKAAVEEAAPGLVATA